MTAKKPFRVRLKGSLYALELYDERGGYIYDLQTAIDTATRKFGSELREVYNGREGWSAIDQKFLPEIMKGPA